MKLAFLILTFLVLSALFSDIFYFPYLNVAKSKILIFTFIFSNAKIAGRVTVYSRYHWSLSCYQVAQELSAWALQSNVALKPGFVTV